VVPLRKVPVPIIWEGTGGLIDAKMQEKSDLAACILIFLIIADFVTSSYPQVTCISKVPNLKIFLKKTY
jgi:hypothetical protein